MPKIRRVPRWVIGLIIFAVVLGGVAFAYVTQKPEGRYFDSNGVKIYYTDEGQGEPVILVHGFAATADLNWRLPGIVRRLARHYRVITFDHRGHGLSEKPHDPKLYGREMVEDITRLMDHLGIEKAHVVGYSMGGFITLKYLTLHPERLLSAAVCGAGWSKPEGENLQLLQSLAESLEHDGGFDVLIQRLEPKGRSVSAVKMAGINAVMGLSNDKKALAALIRSFPEFIVTEEDLRKNQVPVISIVGADDPMREGVDRMQGVLANLTTVYVADRDHMTTVRSREFFDRLFEFLQQHSQAPATPKTPTEQTADRRALDRSYPSLSAAL